MEPGIALGEATRRDWSERLPGSRYDRSAVASGVAHLGVGNFHRAHQAMFHERLLDEQGALEWGICGIGALARDAAIRDVLRAQDGLYTLVERDGDGTESARVIGALTRYVLAAEDREAAVARLAAAPIVSLTVTEGGYGVEPEPGPAFGLIAEALERRRAAGDGPFTVMACDNLEGNGAAARSATLAAAERRGGGLAAWLGREGAFPSSTVDRITPATTDMDRAHVLERYGVRDGWPVVCETFAQWVLEDAFCAGRPDYAAVGVQLVEDVRPYELAKLRVLNGGHQALAYFGALLGFEQVHEAVADPDVHRFLDGYMREAASTLPEVPGVDVDAYRETLLERFANPALRDTIARLGEDSANRVPRFVGATARARLADGADAPFSAAVAASWVVWGGDPAPLGDLLDADGFAAPYRAALDTLGSDGPRAALTSASGPRGAS